MPLNQDEASPAEVDVVSAETTVEQSPEPTPEAEAKEVEAKAEKPADDEDRTLKKVQKRIDRLTREKYQLRAELDLLKRGQQPEPEQRGFDRSQFASDEDYLEAVVEERLARKEAEKAAQSMAQKRDSVLKEAEKLGDFDREEFAEVPITRIMADAILESDTAPKLVKYFHDNPEEAERIASLKPARQAAEIGKIEDRLIESKPAPKTAAPAPIKPVAGGGKAGTGYRPDMSLAEYAKLRGSRLKFKD